MTNQVMILGAEAILIAVLVLILFRLRSRLGLSPLYVALGVFQPIQVFLASSIYVEILPGFLISPGSVIMFTASLFAILLVYIREDAIEARKVIYGIMVANLTMTLLLLVFGAQLDFPDTLNFLGLPKELFNQGGRVMFAGTLALFGDVLLIIFVFEAVIRFIPGVPFLRIYLTMALILIFDTLIFATGAFYGQSNYGPIVLSGIAGKVIIAAFYSAALDLYLRFIEPTDSVDSADVQPFRDIFYALTYREKYEIEHKHSKESLRRSEEKFRAIFNSVNDAIFMIDAGTGEVLDVNQRMCEMIGYSYEETQKLSVIDLSSGEPSYTEASAADWLEKANKGQSQIFEWHCKKKNGQFFWAEINMRTASIGNKERVLVVARDITDRKQAKIERKKMQAQLLQSQKMESVGRLAGGVAHDFNNMLSVIIGYAELNMEKVDPSGPLHANLAEILTAAKKSTDITRQLLAFARQQTIAPRIIDLSENIEGMLSMLRRLIGEDIDLLWKPAKARLPVKVDPSQIDQILANLCVNARDAISDVGKVIIETDTVTFNEAYCADHVGFVPGDFVLLAVSDDGCGMDRETLDNIFEPFFTTKDVGKGTGLGLATVYGIVKQNNGFINVYSEPGKGTTLKIFLPQPAVQAVPAHREKTPEPPSSRGETVLLVEDDASILRLGRRMLEDLSYTVLSASTPGKAIDLAGKRAGEIDLLITDVVMPEMNGRDLANQLQILYPDLKVLFMSGYTADVIAHRGVLDEDVWFISKPFSIKELAVKIREVLEASMPSTQD